MNAKAGILDVLRSSAKVTAEGVVMTYKEYVGGLQPPLALNSVSLDPLSGTSLIVIDLHRLFLLPR